MKRDCAMSSEVEASDCVTQSYSAGFLDYARNDRQTNRRDPSKALHRYNDSTI